MIDQIDYKYLTDKLTLDEWSKLPPSKRKQLKRLEKKAKKYLVKKYNEERSQKKDDSGTNQRNQE